MPTRILLSLLLGWMSATLSKAAERDTLSVRILSYETPVEGVLVGQGRQYLPIEVRAYEPGPVLQLEPERGELMFYRASAQAERTRLGVAAIPPGMRSVILVFVPVESDGSDDPYRVLVFDNDERAFPAGAIRVINLSPFSLALQVGSEEQVIRSGRGHTLSPEVDGKYRFFARFAAQRADGDWRLFHEGPLSLRPQRRMTCLVAFSSSVLAARDEDGPRLPDGRPAPDLVIVPWQDYVPAGTAGRMAGLWEMYP